ncbi:unnamed protein product [Closterium sp. NIES-54]
MARLTAPLTDLLWKGVTFTWGEKEHAAFSALKNVLYSPPVLRIADPHCPFEVVTDARDIAIRAVLLQDFGNGLQPIAYESRKLHLPGKNYQIHDREMLAIVHAFKVWRCYLTSADVTSRRPALPVASPCPACRVALLAIASPCPARRVALLAVASPCHVTRVALLAVASPCCPSAALLPARRPALPALSRSAARTTLLHATLLLAPPCCSPPSCVQPCCSAPYCPRAALLAAAPLPAPPCPRCPAVRRPTGRRPSARTALLLAPPCCCLPCWPAPCCCLPCWQPHPCPRRPTMRCPTGRRPALPWLCTTLL